MQNKTKNENDNAVDLQTMMFEQMKRLSNPENDLDKEIKRAQALASAGTVIINAEKVRIDTVRVQKLLGLKPTNKALGNG